MTSSAAWCDTCQTSRTGSFMCMHDDCPHGNTYKPTFVSEERIPPTVDDKPILMCDRCDQPGKASCIRYGCEFVEGGYHNPISRERATAIAKEEAERGNKTKEFADNKYAYDVRKLHHQLVMTGLPSFIEKHGVNVMLHGYSKAVLEYTLAMLELAEQTVKLGTKDQHVDVSAS